MDLFFFFKVVSQWTLTVCSNRLPFTFSMITCRLYLSRFRRPIYLQRASLVKWGQSKICRTAALWATLVLLSVHESATEKSKVTNRQRADAKLSVKNNTVTVCAFPAASPVPDELRRSSTCRPVSICLTRSIIHTAYCKVGFLEELTGAHLWWLKFPKISPQVGTDTVA